MIQCSARPFPYPIARQALKVIRSLRGQGKAGQLTPSRRAVDSDAQDVLPDWFSSAYPPWRDPFIIVSVSFCQLPLRQGVSKNLPMFCSCPGWRSGLCDASGQIAVIKGNSSRGGSQRPGCGLHPAGNGGWPDVAIPDVGGLALC